MSAIKQQQQIGGLMDEIQEQTFFSPTFSSYSSDKLAEIAARVSNEFKKESAEKADHHPEMFIQEDDDDDDDDDEFEFSLVLEDSSNSNVFYDGKPDEPIFPIFKFDFLADHKSVSDERDERDDHDQISDGEIRIPLKELFKREREHEVSDDGDMANIPPGTYCVWKPKLKESSQKMCKKSKSTGGSMSKRWKILDLLRRSNSDGNESYMFLTPKHREKSDRPPTPSPARRHSSDDVVKRSGGKKTPPSSSPSPHETFYVRNRAIKEGDKRKSYLPYRQVLVGFFANVNGFKKTYPPF